MKTGHYLQTFSLFHRAHRLRRSVFGGSRETTSGKTVSRRPPLPNPPDFSSARFIFLAGLHRSGTSLIHRALRRHADVSGFELTGAKEDEGQFLQTVFPIAGKFGGPGRFAFDKRARLDETSSVCTPDNARILAREWGAYLDLEQTVFIEKSPPNITKTRFLQAMFPTAYFVIVVRHPIPVSIATQKWSKTTDAELLLHWCVAHEVLLADIPSLERTLIVRYEDFVEHPQGELRRLQRFAGLNNSKAGERIEDRNSLYFQLWEGEGRGKHLGVAPDLFNLTAAKFGYSLGPPYIDGRWPGLEATQR